MTLRLYLFDDPVARGWDPFSDTRPVGELLFGSLLLRERAERAVSTPARGYLDTAGLSGFSEPGAPPIIPADALPRNAPVLLLSTRYVPELPEEGPASVLGLDEIESESPSGLIRLEVAGEAVGWLLPAGEGNGGRVREAGPDLLEVLRRESVPEAVPSKVVEAPGSVLRSPWDLVDRNTDRLGRDLAHVFTPDEHREPRLLPELPGVRRIGEAPVIAESEVSIDPGAILDTRSGPIHLERGVRIRPLTHLRGPAIIGRGTTLLGGVFEALSCGPVCKLRGEIEASVVLGYSNKAHDGYLGHSVLGRWVNLGAFTTNSDLKNNYGNVKVVGPSGDIDTGLLKLGVFLGDHVKTGIGTLLNAGTIVGAGTNLFGGRMPPKRVPPFSWGSGGELGVHRKEAFLDTAERAMGRRGVPLSPEHRTFLSALWNRVQEESREGASR